MPSQFTLSSRYAITYLFNAFIKIHRPNCPCLLPSLYSLLLISLYVLRNTMPKGGGKNETKESDWDDRNRIFDHKFGLYF